MNVYGTSLPLFLALHSSTELLIFTILLKNEKKKKSDDKEGMGK